MQSIDNPNSTIPWTLKTCTRRHCLLFYLHTHTEYKTTVKGPTNIYIHTNTSCAYPAGAVATHSNHVLVRWFVSTGWQEECLSHVELHLPIFFYVTDEDTCMFSWGGEGSSLQGRYPLCARWGQTLIEGDQLLLQLAVVILSRRGQFCWLCAHNRGLLRGFGRMLCGRQKSLDGRTPPS